MQVVENLNQLMLCSTTLNGSKGHYHEPVNSKINNKNYNNNKDKKTKTVRSVSGVKSKEPTVDDK